MAFQSLCFPSVNEDKNLFYFTELLQGLNEIMHIKLFIRHLASSKYSINHSCSKAIILSTILTNLWIPARAPTAATILDTPVSASQILGVLQTFRLPVWSYTYPQITMPLRSLLSSPDPIPVSLLSSVSPPQAPTCSLDTPSALLFLFLSVLAFRSFHP